MASAPTDIPWWCLIDRAGVIRASADFARVGGILVLRGPAAFGHLEALRFTAHQMTRFGWLCHDISLLGPRDGSSIALEGLEAIAPTSSGSFSHRALLSGIGLSYLREHINKELDRVTDRHAWLVPYCDEHNPLDRKDMEFLSAITSDKLSIVLTSLGPTDFDDVDCEVVELVSFTVRHLELCLRRAQVFDILENRLADALPSMLMADGSVLPLAAYTWLQRVAQPEVRS